MDQRRSLHTDTLSLTFIFLSKPYGTPSLSISPSVFDVNIIVYRLKSLNERTVHTVDRFTGREVLGAWGEGVRRSRAAVTLF
jgi:hypothetical protein